MQSVTRGIEAASLSCVKRGIRLYFNAMGNKSGKSGDQGSKGDGGSSSDSNLVAAAKRGDMATVQKLLTDGICDIDERDVFMSSINTCGGPHPTCRLL